MTHETIARDNEPTVKQVAVACADVSGRIGLERRSVRPNTQGVVSRAGSREYVVARRPPQYRAREATTGPNGTAGLNTELTSSGGSPINPPEYLKQFLRSHLGERTGKRRWIPGWRCKACGFVWDREQPSEVLLCPECGVDERVPHWRSVRIEEDPRGDGAS